jgi:FMN phosphatase YigB (HAD superfamily)
MVGDSPDDDTGAARLGVRTLILPRTRGPVHGLEVVLRLVGGGG